MGEEPRSLRARKSLIAGARDWVEELGETPDLLEVAFREMDKQGLTMKTPRSCIAVGVQLRRTGRGQDAGRYLSQSLVDDDE